MKKLQFKNMLPLFMLFLFIACTEEIDFNQVDDLALLPVVEMSLVYFDQTASALSNAEASEDVVQDFITIEFLNDKFIADNLYRLEITFETFNSVNRAFEMRVDFLNNDNEPQYGFLISEAAAPNNVDEVTEQVIVIEEDELDQVKNATKIFFTLRMLPGTPLNETTPGRLTFKSSAGFYFNIENNR